MLHLRLRRRNGEDWIRECEISIDRSAALDSHGHSAVTSRVGDEGGNDFI